jgi:hypothetical protein
VLIELWYTRQVAPGGAWAPWVNAGYVGKAGQEDFRFSRESATLDPSGRLNLVVRGHLGEWFLQQAARGTSTRCCRRPRRPRRSPGRPASTCRPAWSISTRTPHSPAIFTGNPAQSGDYVGVDLGIRRPIKTVEFVMGPDGYIHQGVVEYSSDGTGWTPLATVADTPDVTVALPSGVTVQYVRLRATANEAQPVSVREIRTA